MQQPLQITIRDMKHSPAVEAHIREEVDKLNHYFDNIISCHVVVEYAQKNQNKGKIHHVRVSVGVPGKEITSDHNQDENLYIALRDAFDDMARQLKNYVRRIHGAVKTHPELIHGEIVRLFKDDGFGFIRTQDDDTEYYFNMANVVSPKFEHLTVGTQVHFIEAMGNEGPQAHRVSAGKHSGKT